MPGPQFHPAARFPMRSCFIPFRDCSPDTITSFEPLSDVASHSIPMNSTSNQFGLLVAYLLPGFIGLAGIAPFAPLVSAWLRPGSYAEASLGAPVYAILAATTIGMIASPIRWLLIDHIHHWTGVTPPVWDDSRLEQRLTAFNYLVESHYRYYQFLANSLIVIICAYAINRAMRTSPFLGAGTDIAFFILCATLFAGSRDALSKYYTRTGRLIGHVAEKDAKVHHDER